MAQSLEQFEKGLRIFKANSNTDYIDFLFGSSTPGGDADEQDAAPIGSTYFQKNGATSKIYQKQTNVGSTADWIENSSTGAVIGSWRSEKVSILTNDTQGAGTRDVVASPFADDDGTPLAPADFIVGEYIISDADGTPALLEITVVAGDDVTFAAAGTALVAEDTFIVTHYLPDGDTQENKAMVNFTGSIMVKIGDIDWNVATGINLDTSIVDRNGPVTAGDSLQVSTEKLEGDAKDLYSSLGTARGDTNMGVFSLSFFSAAQTVKQLFQKVEFFINQLFVAEVTGISTPTAIYTSPHGGGQSGKFLLFTFEVATPANTKYLEISYTTNGTDVDYSIGKIQKTGANFNVDVSMAVNGANVELNVDSTTTVSTKFRRLINIL